MPTLQVSAAERSALLTGSELAVSIFRTWRRDLDCIDALILLVIARSNVDGILFNRQLRSRYGGSTQIAPDHLRQPVSVDIVAMSLRLPSPTVRRRTLALAQRGECELTSNGMLIAQHQLEATNHAAVVEAVYRHVRTAYVGLRETSDSAATPVLSLEPGAERPVRAVAAHGARYLLRLLSSAGRHFADPRDCLLLIHRLARKDDGPLSAAGDLGFSSRGAHRRISRLRIVAGYDEPFGQSWFADLAHHNMNHLFQFFAALEEVGAVAGFERV